MVVLIVLLGLLGFLVEPLFILIFIAVLGYYLYKLEKRTSALEAGAPERKQQ